MFRRKTDLGTRSILLALLVLLITLPGTTFAQNVSFKVHNATVREAVIKLQKDLGYSIIVKSNDLDMNKRVSIDQNNGNINTLLDTIFKGQNVVYSINGKTINIKKDSPKKQKKVADSKDFFIKGKVSDSNGEPLIGVNIKNTDTSSGTVTDMDGNFSILGKKGETLQISYIGYASKEIMISSDRVDVQLSEASQMLDDVVVVGFGSQKKVNLTGAVAVIKNDEINGRPVVSAAQALQGLDPSMNIGISSGVANSGYQIDIRGTASLNGGSPLVLIDGIEMDLNKLNPNDIESVSILKDASASAVYGAKASSGVVLITTKTGSKSEPKVTFNGRYGFAKSTTNTDYITKGYDWVSVTDLFMKTSKGYGYTSYGDDDYAELWMRRNDKVENPDHPWVKTQSDGTYKYYGNFDWYGYLYNRTRNQQEYNATIKGGTEKSDYYVSGRYYHNEGLMKIQNDPFDSYNIRAKLNIKIKPWLRYSINTNYYYGKMWWPGMKSIQTTFRNASFGGGAYIVPRNPDGSIVHLQTYTNQSAPVLNGMNLLLSYGKTSNNDIQNEVSIKNNFDIDLLKGLVLHLSHAYKFDHSFVQNRYANAPYSTEEGKLTWLTTSYCTDRLIEYNRSLYKQTYEGYLDYNHSFAKKHNLKVTAGMQYDTRYYRQNTITAEGMLSEDLNDFNLASGTNNLVTGGQSKYKTLGIFGRINYDYVGKYLLEISGRADGSSRFWSKNRWGYFPSASVGWRMSEESFWQPMQSWWDNAKLRFSIGSLGNQQIDDYLYVQTINTKIVNNSFSINGEDYLTYAQESAPVAGDLTWETVKTYDLGIDLGFFNSRLNFTGDAYIRNTLNMMWQGASLPSVYGASEPKMNSADMQTKGWELGLSWHDNFKLLGKNFAYDIHGNIGDYQSEITRFDNDTRLITSHYKGEKLGEIWGFKTDGLFKSDEEAANYPVNCSLLTKRIIAAPDENKGLRAGDVKFVDLDDDKVLTIGKNTVDDPGDRVVIGNSLPRYSYSFGGNFSWYGFDFNILFQGIGKRYWYPGSGETNMFWGPYCRPHNTFLSQQFVDNVWSETNPNAYFPRPRAYEAYSSETTSFYTLTTPNDRYLQNIAYLRLKNLTLGYTLPCLKKYIDNMRLYVSGENLAYWSPFKKHSKYIDPEAPVSTTAYTKGSGEVYGFSKVLSFGLDITF